MILTRRLSVLAPLLVSTLLMAQADGPRVLDFPQHGLRVTLPPEWSVSQRSPRVIAHFARDTARVGVYPAGTTPQQLWAMSGGEGEVPAEWTRPRPQKGPARQRGVVGATVRMGERTAWLGRVAGDLATAPIVLARPTGSEAALRTLLEGFERVAFENPRRFIDWTRGYAVEVPEGWVRLGDAQARAASSKASTIWVPASAAGEPARAALSLRIAGARAVAGTLGFPSGLISEAERQRVIDLVVPRGEGAPSLWDERWSVTLATDERLERRFRWRGLDSPGKTPSRILLGRLVDGFVVWLDVRRSAAPRASAVKTAEAAQKALESFTATLDTEASAATSKVAGRRSRFARDDAPKVSFVLPRGWKALDPSSRMRLATYRLPGTEPLDLIVYFFGAGDGGSAKANTDRWVGQFDPKTTSSVKEMAISSGIKATFVDVSGTYAAALRPGGADRANQPGSRMLAATIEVEGGPLFFKLVGPEAAVAAAAPKVSEWLRSFRR